MLQLKNAVTTDVKTTVTIFLIVSPNNCYAIVMEFFIEHNMHICILPKTKKTKTKNTIKNKTKQKNSTNRKKRYMHIYTCTSIYKHSLIIHERSKPIQKCNLSHCKPNTNSNCLKAREGLEKIAGKNWGL